MGSGRVVAAIDAARCGGRRRRCRRASPPRAGRGPAGRAPRAAASACSTSRATPVGEALGARRGRRASWPDRAVRVDDRHVDDLRRDLGQVGERLGSVHGAGAYCGSCPPQAIAASPGAAAGSGAGEVLRRPRHAPRGDDRVLRAALVRAAALPLARRCSAWRTRRTRARSSCASCSGRSRARRSTRSCTRCGRSRRTRRALGIVGAAFLLWSSLSLFSVLESAFNIVYGRPNRGFLHGKALASLMMVGSLVVLFASLVVGSVGAELLQAPRRRRRQRRRSRRVVSVGVSLVGIFVFLATAYYVLTNAELTWREVLPGAVAAAVMLEATFQLLPQFVRVSKPQPGAAGALVAGGAARVALRDGERDRARRGGELHQRTARASEASAVSSVLGGSGQAPALRSRPRPRAPRRAAAVRVLALPVVAELGDRPRRRRPGRRSGRSRSRPSRARSRAIAPSRTPVPRSSSPSGESATSSATIRARAVRLAAEPLEQRVGLVAARRPARRVQARLAAERVALDARVLAEHPRRPAPRAPRPNRAFSRAFSSYVAPVSSGQPSATSGSISQPGSAARSSSSLCAFCDASRARRVSAATGPAITSSKSETRDDELLVDAPASVERDDAAVGLVVAPRASARSPSCPSSPAHARPGAQLDDEPPLRRPDGSIAWKATIRSGPSANTRERGPDHRRPVVARARPPSRSRPRSTGSPRSSARARRGPRG